MKISNSKKELARIISENGGWRDGAEFSVQNGEHGRISFSTSKPVRHDQKSWMAKGGFQFKIEARKPLPNWHQTVLSREEYFHLYPATDADGWIEWRGGNSPVKDGVMIETKWSDGDLVCHAYFGSQHHWTIEDDHPSITAYRLHKPEQAKSAAVGDDQANLADKKELETMEYKPSIDQLMQTYVDRAHSLQLANERMATCTKQVNEALDALSVACKYAGFDIAPITAKQEPELVITDWRDLQVGDEVKAVKRNGGNIIIGEVGVISEVSNDGFWSKFPSASRYYYYDRNFADGSVIFIRRP